MDRLSYAGNEAARRYLNGEIDRTAAAAWLTRFALMSPPRAEQRTRFMDDYRSYVINYNLGKDLVRQHVEARGGSRRRSREALGRVRAPARLAAPAVRPSKPSSLHDDRLPLPPRRRGVRRGSRRGRRARARTPASSARWRSSRPATQQEAAQAERLEAPVAGGARRRSASTRTPRTSSPTIRSARPTSCATQIARTPSARAVGEIGLDYHYDFSPRDVQQAVFRAQIRAGARARAAGRHPHARGRRRHARDPARRRAAARCAACCTASPGRPALARAGARPRLLHLARRHRDVPEGRRAARDGAAGAARSAARRDRQPVSGAGAAPRQAERAGVRRAGRRRRSRALHRRRRPATLAARTTANFHTPVPPVIESN